MKFDPEQFTATNHQEFSEVLDSMTWLTQDQAEKASDVRESLLKAIFEKPDTSAGWLFGKTKLYTHEISPGCRLCGQGDWSCLFINNICNARCFYCPDHQAVAGIPVTNSLEFKNPADYSDYINACGIKGVSFSGGEPFMTFDRVTNFLKTLRKSVKHPLYIWMYTNGILVTPDKLAELRDLGLDEIRFDISANDYALDKMRMAVGNIPHVTVEIPAIPDDIDRMKGLAQTLYDDGVNYLNLHQIRCTPFNAAKLVRRGYTFLHGPKVTVLDTELAALTLIRHTIDASIRLPINYCSYIYRYQYQSAGARRRSALFMKKAYEEITGPGFLRSFSLAGPEERLAAVHNRLSETGVPPESWKYEKAGKRLFFSASLWPAIDMSGCLPMVSYFTTNLRQQVSYRNPFKEIKLNAKQKLIAEKKTEAKDISISQSLAMEFQRRISGADPDSPDRTDRTPDWDLVRDWEEPREGLVNYY